MLHLRRCKRRSRRQWGRANGMAPVYRLHQVIGKIKFSAVNVSLELKAKVDINTVLTSLVPALASTSTHLHFEMADTPLRRTSAHDLQCPKPVGAATLLADVSATMRLVVPPLNDAVAAAMARDEEFPAWMAAQAAVRAAIEESRIKVRT